MKEMLALSAHLPLVEFAAGEVITTEGGTAGPIWILVSGSLQIRKGQVVVNTVTEPGSLIGEISLLLNSAFSATVETTAPTVMRFAEDGRALLTSNPAISTLVAVGLADRLNFVTTYLADLKHQYGSTPGLSMIPAVLERLAQHQTTTARPGSAREPDPEY